MQFDAGAFYPQQHGRSGRAIRNRIAASGVRECGSRVVASEAGRRRRWALAAGMVRELRLMTSALEGAAVSPLSVVSDVETAWLWSRARSFAQQSAHNLRITIDTSPSAVGDATRADPS